MVNQFKLTATFRLSFVGDQLLKRRKANKDTFKGTALYQRKTKTIGLVVSSADVK
jgi:hypothetical protein